MQFYCQSLCVDSEASLIFLLEPTKRNAYQDPFQSNNRNTLLSKFSFSLLAPSGNTEKKSDTIIDSDDQ